VTGFFSVVGIVIAAALRRWSARPAERRKGVNGRTDVAPGPATLHSRFLFLVNSKAESR